MLVSNSLLFGTSNLVAAALSRPSVVRLCVEVDLLKDLPSRIWVQLGEGHGFWQLLNPEILPIAKAMKKKIVTLKIWNFDPN